MNTKISKEQKYFLHQKYKKNKKIKDKKRKKDRDQKLFNNSFQDDEYSISKKEINRIFFSKAYNKCINQVIKISKIRKLKLFFINYINHRIKSDYIHHKYINYDINGNNNSNFFEARFNQKRINDIINLIFNETKKEIIFKNIKSYGFSDGTLYKTQNNKKIGKQFIDKNRRNGLKKIIRKKPLCRPLSITYKRLTRILDGGLKNIFDFYFDEYKYSNHIDILYYPKGGFFSPHRDDIKTGYLKEMQDQGYKIFTVIICLENAVDYNDGSTLVWSKYMNTTSHFTMKKHIFNTGSKKGNVLIFKSDLLHGVTITNSSILKLKFEICVKTIRYEKLLEMKYYTCKCETCNSDSKYNEQIKIWKTFYCKNPDKYLPISNDIILEISSYLGYLVKCNCFHKNESSKQLYCEYSTDYINKNCNCGCNLCVNENFNCHCEEYILNNNRNYYYDSDMYEQDYDTHCNGDDY